MRKSLDSRKRERVGTLGVSIFVLAVLPSAALGGYWKIDGTPIVIARHESPAQYGHEYKIVSSGDDFVRMNYRDGLSGNRTDLLIKWSVPSIIVPGEVLPASAAYAVTGPKGGGFLIRFDLPGGNTDGGVDLLDITLSDKSPAQLQVSNTKIKAPDQRGDRALHIYAALTGGISFKVKIPYRWMEGTPPDGAASPGAPADIPAPRIRRLIYNGNADAVRNGGAPAVFRFDRAYVITLIQTYHWNDGRGTAAPGTIGLKDERGREYGPFPAAGSKGQGGVPNAYWKATLNLILEPGTYTVHDSDPATWSQNAGTKGRGIVLIEGYAVSK